LGPCFLGRGGGLGSRGRVWCGLARRLAVCPISGTSGPKTPAARVCDRARAARRSAKAEPLRAALAEVGQLRQGDPVGSPSAPPAGVCAAESARICRTTRCTAAAARTFAARNKARSACAEAVNVRRATLSVVQLASIRGLVQTTAAPAATSATRTPVRPFAHAAYARPVAGPRRLRVARVASICRRISPIAARATIAAPPPRPATRAAVSVRPGSPVAVRCASI